METPPPPHPERGSAARKVGRSGSASLGRPLEGVLSKYTNLLQGWQNSENPVN